MTRPIRLLKRRYSRRSPLPPSTLARHSEQYSIEPMTEKLAVGKQMGGFMQHRQRTRPLRVETLLAREDSRSPSNVFQPDKDYEKALAKDESPEFLEEGASEKTAAEIVHLKGEDAQRFGQQFPDAKVRGRDVIAAKEGDRVVGGIVVKPKPDEYTAAIVKKHAPGRESTGHVSFFYVDPDQRNKGVGSQLMAEALHGRGDVTLGTDNRGVNTNEGAVRLYKSVGFEPLKRERRSTFWLKKQGALKPEKGEFAPGIAKERRIERIPGVPERGPNKEWMVSLATHPAAVRGDHFDMRLTDPQGRSHSWAFNDLPEPGKGTYAAQQPTHSRRYALRKKPFSIPTGVYGGTRPGAKVEPKYVQPAEVISADNNRVHFLRHHGQETEEFVLKRISTPPRGSPLWALRNATKTRETQEGRLLPADKNRYKEVAPEQIDLSDDQQVMTPKLDGAHVLVAFPKAGKMMRVHSYRPTQRSSGLIEHTFKFPGFQNRKTPKALQGTIIRAELYGTDEKGKAIPAPELGGILNSSVPNARRAQEEDKVTLRLAGLDVVRHNGRNYQDKSFNEKLEVLRQVSRQTGGKIEQLPTAVTSEEKKKLLEDIKAGRYARTREGVVLHELNTSGPPTKSKFKPDHDVYVKEVFTKKTSPEGQAGGFAYSFEPDGPIVGRVGTGFSRQLRKDMAANPEQFIGRVAKVQSSGRYQSRRDKTQGALVGAPAFKEWHIDKTPPELMKEGEEKSWSSTLANFDPKKLKEFVQNERRIKAMMRLKSEVGKLRADWGGKDGSH